MDKEIMNTISQILNIIADRDISPQTTIESLIQILEEFQDIIERNTRDAVKSEAL